MHTIHTIVHSAVCTICACALWDDSAGTDGCPSPGADQYSACQLSKKKKTECEDPFASLSRSPLPPLLPSSPPPLPPLPSPSPLGTGIPIRREAIGTVWREKWEREREDHQQTTYPEDYVRITAKLRKGKKIKVTTFVLEPACWVGGA